MTNLISCPSMPSGSFPTVVVLDDVINVHRRELPLSAFYRSSTTSVYIYIFKCISKFIVSLRKGQYLLLSIAIFALRNHWNSLSQIAFILRNTSVFFSCWYNTTFISKHKYILFKKLISTRFIYCFAMLLYVRIYFATIAIEQFSLYLLSMNFSCDFLAVFMRNLFIFNERSRPGTKEHLQ